MEIQVQQEHYQKNICGGMIPNFAEADISLLEKVDNIDFRHLATSLYFAVHLVSFKYELLEIKSFTKEFQDFFLNCSNDWA